MIKTKIDGISLCFPTEKDHHHFAVKARACVKRIERGKQDLRAMIAQAKQGKFTAPTLPPLEFAKRTPEEIAALPTTIMQNLAPLFAEVDAREVCQRKGGQPLP